MGHLSPLISVKYTEALCSLKSWLKGLICALLTHVSKRAAEPLLCLLYCGTDSHIYQGLQHLLGNYWRSWPRMSWLLGTASQKISSQKAKNSTTKFKNCGITGSFPARWEHGKSRLNVISTHLYVSLIFNKAVNMDLVHHLCTMHMY